MYVQQLCVLLCLLLQAQGNTVSFDKRKSTLRPGLQMTTRCRHFLLQALGDSVADSFCALLGEASMDKFNPDLLREEPTDKVSGNGLPQASTQRAFRWRRLLETHVF